MVRKHHMNTIVPRSMWLVPLATLALFGAGCFSSDPAPVAPPATPPTNQVPSQPSTPTQPNPTTPTPTPTPAPNQPSGPVTLPTIDATWKTYTNKAETFSFQWPTKGRLAPTWEVSLPSKLDNGCFKMADFGEPIETKRLTVGSQEFCHTSYRDAGMSQRYFSDYYATVMNGQNVVIGFEKHLVVGDVIGDGACKGMLVLPGSTEKPCLEVKPDAYQAHLDQIVNTFQVLK